jgi:hypothetical protein
MRIKTLNLSDLSDDCHITQANTNKGRLKSGRARQLNTAIPAQAKNSF